MGIWSTPSKPDQPRVERVHGWSREEFEAIGQQSSMDIRLRWLQRTSSWGIDSLDGVLRQRQEWEVRGVVAHWSDRVRIPVEISEAKQLPDKYAAIEEEIRGGPRRLFAGWLNLNGEWEKPADPETLRPLVDVILLPDVFRSIIREQRVAPLDPRQERAVRIFTEFRGEWKYEAFVASMGEKDRLSRWSLPIVKTVTWATWGYSGDGP